MLHAGKAQVSRTQSSIEHTAQQEAHSQKGTQPERHTARRGTQPERHTARRDTQPERHTAKEAHS
jgi:hypothetical protein